MRIGAGGGKDFGTVILYWHLAKARGQLGRLELLDVVNQVIFHLHSVYAVRGLSQRVSGGFAVLVSAGAASRYLTQ